MDAVTRPSNAPGPIERTKVREVAGVFRAQSALDAAVGAFLATGFDRSDIDIMASAETAPAARRRLYSG